MQPSSDSLQRVASFTFIITMYKAVINGYAMLHSFACRRNHEKYNQPQ